MSATRAPSARAERWTPAEIAALLRALEPLSGPWAPACSVTVHDDRRIDLAPEPSAAPPAHGTLVHAGRLVGAVENALRSMGRAPRTVIAELPDAGPLVMVAGTRRRPATPRDLARRRAGRRAGHPSSPRSAAPADRAKVSDIARGACSRGAWLHLLNGPTRDGAPAWRTPGSAPAAALALDVPWRRDPVLAVCTHADDARDAVVAGIVVERATLEAALRGLRTGVHVDAFDDPVVRAAALADTTDENGVGHAALHLWA